MDRCLVCGKLKCGEMGRNGNSVELKRDLGRISRYVIFFFVLGLLADSKPLCLTHDAPPLPPPEPIDVNTLLPQKRGPWFLRPFLTPRLPDLTAYVASHPNPNRPQLGRTDTAITLPPIKPVWTVPEDGEEVTLGVLIAMPVEGKAADLWDLDDRDEDESEVPEVCLGVMTGHMRH